MAGDGSSNNDDHGRHGHPSVPRTLDVLCLLVHGHHKIKFVVVV